MSSSTSNTPAEAGRTATKPLRRMLASPFLYALVPSVLFYTVILSRNWIPIHDAFQITNIAYFIFNETAKHHAVPLWYPYINYGVDANWYLLFTLGPSLATLLPVAWLLGSGDLLHYYYVSMFLDELILLVGTYLLARTLFKSRLTIVFVCVAMTGSTLWFAQPWWNFHLYYFVPLSAYLIITGAARTELWRVLAGGLVLLISEFGNLPYFPVVHALTYALLLAGAWWAYRFDVRSALRRAGARELIVCIASVLTAGVYLVLLAYGVHHINYDLGRTRNVVSPVDFLTYGGAIGVTKFTELFTGTSFDLDANAYAGVLVTSSAIFGLLWRPERRMAPFFGAGAFLTLLSLGQESFVAPLIYEIPGVAYYRHLGLVLPLIKVMLIVLSGFGFDALVSAGRRTGEEATGGARQAYLTKAAILVLMLGVALVVAGLAAYTMRAFHHQYVFSELSRASNGFDNHVVQFLDHFALVAVFYAAAVGVLVAGIVRPRTLPVSVVGIALLAIQIVDVYSYRMSQFQLHMVPIDAQYRQLFAFSNKPFALERVRDPMTNDAFRVVEAHFNQRIEPGWYEFCTRTEAMHCYYNFGDTKEGVHYNTTEPFAGFDPCRSIFRIDYWLPGVDAFYRAATGLPLHDLDALPRGYEHINIYFPITDTRVEKAIGCEFPKLQLFSSVTVIRSESEMARFMRGPTYRGDLLLASASDYTAYRRDGGMGEPGGIEDPAAETPLNADTRARGQVRLLRASANSIAVRTTLPSRRAKYWLYVADAWHPFWHAQVNGAAAPILRANFAFQAVQVPGGEATVTLTYRSALLSSAFATAEVLLVATMLLVLMAARRLLKRG
ncbi:MAG TPA: hypothetical protein VJT33_11800 [bacterium]|nr:hypothetical protein [bacterium]